MSVCVVLWKHVAETHHRLTSWVEFSNLICPSGESKLVLWTSQLFGRSPLRDVHVVRPSHLILRHLAILGPMSSTREVPCIPVLLSTRFPNLKT